MIRTLTALFALLAAPLAHADEPKEITAPEAGSPEEALRESLILMKKHEPRKWMDTWCTPSRCANPLQREDLEKYMLKQAQEGSKHCLFGDNDAMKIKKIKGDPAADEKLTITLVCSHTEYPPPALLEKVEGKWYVSTIPW